MPVAECELTLTSTLEDLSRDPWPTKPDERMARCTGVAMSVAISLLEVAKCRVGRCVHIPFR
jgi:protein transport protein SEC23